LVSEDIDSIKMRRTTKKNDKCPQF